MARNRKRAKERRARRPQGASVAATGRRERDVTPDPIEHASPDVELAEAQLALGRPELTADAELEPDDNEPEYEQGPDEAELGEDVGGDGSPAGGDGSPPGGTLVAPGGPTPAPRERVGPGTRLVNFIQGSWRELQRVQWPDRRQVMQATGVVIGFVIVAGVFLGVADFAATKVMNYILTGHFK